MAITATIRTSRSSSRSTTRLDRPTNQWSVTRWPSTRWTNAGQLRLEATGRPPLVATAVDGASADQVEVLPLAAEYLDGGEIVILAIKPSPWFVFFDALRWVLLGAVLVVIGAVPSLRIAGLSPAMATQLGLLIAAGRLGIAFIRWASRYYVLTNRRVMRLRGVLRPDVVACPLVTIRNTRVQQRFHEKLTRLGTIRFFFEDQSSEELDWREIARCEEVHERVRRAIERAFDSQPHL
jgi:hypothetical protein